MQNSTRKKNNSRPIDLGVSFWAILGECILRVTHTNGNCCQNLVSNTYTIWYVEQACRCAKSYISTELPACIIPLWTHCMPTVLWFPYFNLPQYAPSRSLAKHGTMLLTACSHGIYTHKSWTKCFSLGTFSRLHFGDLFLFKRRERTHTV